MFKNRAIQVKMVKTQNPTNAEEPETVRLDPEQINQIAKEQVKYVAVAVGAIVVGYKVLSTFEEIAVIAAKAKFK